jgi:hypothetical protein
MPWNAERFSPGGAASGCWRETAIVPVIENGLD